LGRINMAGSKHLIQCHCVLPQYRNLGTPVFHKFVVFSKIDSEGNVIAKLCKCNNCGVTHRVFDFCKSEISYGIEDNLAIVSTDDIRESLPERICEILDAHMCDISTWEQVDDILENNMWNESIVISRQEVSGTTQVKCLIIKNKDSFKIESHLRQDDIK